MIGFADGGSVERQQNRTASTAFANVQWVLCLGEDLQFPAETDDIGDQSIQLLDFRVSATLAQVLCGDIPKSITTHHRVDTVLLVPDGSIGVDCGINGGAIIGEYKGSGNRFHLPL